MLDLNAPLELDNGMPVKLISRSYDGAGRAYEHIFEVEIPCGYRRNGTGRPDRYWYDRRTGIWEGGTAEDMYVVRNAPDEEIVEEDWS